MSLLSPERLCRLLDEFEASPILQRWVGHNLGTLRRIRGGRRLAEAHALNFDLRDDYWRQPQRRLIVAWLGASWTERLAPVAAVRVLALHVLRHFDRIDEGVAETFRGVDYARAPGGWTGVVHRMLKHLDRMVEPDPALWDAVRRAWPRETAPSITDALRTHLAWAAEDEARWAAWEPGFRHRAPWLAYLGADTLTDLERRQAYWFGFLNLWTASNAYRRTGSQSFSPVLQNTPADGLLAVASAWSRGEDPRSRPFRGMGVHDEEAQDRSAWSTVVEVYTFLNLHRGPFYNAAVAEALVEALRDAGEVLPSPASPYIVVEAVGQRTRAALDSSPALAQRLDQALRGWQASWPNLTGFEVPLEWSPGLRAAARVDQRPDALIDSQLGPQLVRFADEEVAAHSIEERACIALHLLLDAALSAERGIEAPRTTPPLTRTEPAPTTPVVTAHPRPPDLPLLVAEPPPDLLRLAAPLRLPAGRALAYLRAGFHVLLAGVPGTGKTTIAQFVAHAWNHNLSTVPQTISRLTLPRTTVGNSAWSPFHTIGGMVPVEGRQSFRVAPGIFVDGTPIGDGVYQLLPGALVLDEMNRADLDRCVGELYPLLSDSVREVWPAGIPGMARIVGHPRFRVLATINDSTLDDIVFPISEGLARRFQRIEVPGAEEEALETYVLAGPTGAPDSGRVRREEAATSAVRALFSAAREKGLSAALPLGVGWFRPLQAWVQGELRFDPIEDPKEPYREALEVLRSALRPANARSIRDLLARLGERE
jgi:MoxR-like ATPase